MKQRREMEKLARIEEERRTQVAAAGKKQRNIERELRALKRGAAILVEAAHKPRRGRKAPTGGPGGPNVPVEPQSPVAAATEEVLDTIERTGATEEVVVKAMQKAMKRRVPGINSNNNNNYNNNNNSNMGVAADEPPDELVDDFVNLLNQKASIGGPRMAFRPVPVAAAAAPVAAVGPGMSNVPNGRPHVEEGWGGEATVDDLLASAITGMRQLGL